jgi:hypothetical protein
MTLCAIWSRVDSDVGQQIVMASDSMLTGGYAYPRGCKFTLFERRDCALCWEGDTDYTYSFAAHAKVDLDWSDVLSDPTKSDIICVKKRIVGTFDELWAVAREDKASKHLDKKFSFIFAGYSGRLKQALAWQLKYGDGMPVCEEIDLARPFFAGSGADRARSKEAGGKLAPYRILRDVIDDEGGDVGGLPQLVIIDRRGVTAIAIIKLGEFFLFGRPLAGEGHRGGVLYAQYDDDNLAKLMPRPNIKRVTPDTSAGVG